MPQVAVAVAAAWAGGTAATAAGFTVGTLAYAAVSTAVSMAVMYAGNSVLNDGSDSGTLAPQTTNTTVRQASAARRLIYGNIKAGGVLAYTGQSTDGDAHLVIALGEGEIESIDPVFWLGEDLSADAKFSGLLSFEAHTGSADQLASAALMAAMPGDWTANHRLRGVAYVYVRLHFDRNAFPRGLIFPVFKVRGRKIYDPRTGATAWSDNPALCVLDYLRSTYSVACPDAMIDFDSFKVAANICDEVIVSADPENIVNGVPGRVKRYTLNGAFETSSNPVPVIESMEAACGGKLVFCQGKYRFYAGAYRPPTTTITAEYLRAAPSFRAYPSRQQRVNIARGTYREPRQDWQDTDFAPQQLPAAVIAEAGEIVQNYGFPATTNGATAQRLAKLAMLRARAQTPLVLQCNWAALQWRLWDTVIVNLPEINEVGRTFCIVSYTFAEGGGIDMTLIPDEASHYAWDAAADEVIVEDVPVPDFQQTPPVVAGLIVSGTASSEETAAAISARWDRTNYVFFDKYEVQVKFSTAPDYSSPVESTTVTSNVFQSVAANIPGMDYDVRVRVVSTDGTAGEWAEVIETVVAGDITPPAPPTALSVTGSGTLTVRWKTPVADDFRKSNVYRNAVNNPIGATLMTTIVGVQNTPYSVVDASSGTRHYWVTAQDASGNESALTYAGTGS